MKIAVTVTTCCQVGMDQWRDFNWTRVFDSGETFDAILAWAATRSKSPGVCDLKFSDVDDSAARPAQGSSNEAGGGRERA